MNQDERTHHRVAPKLASLAVLLLATLAMYVSQGLTHTLAPLGLALARHALATIQRRRNHLVPGRRTGTVLAH